MFWRHLSKAQNAGSFNSFDAFAEASAAVKELTKSAKNLTDNSVRVGSVPRAKFQEFYLDLAHFAGPGVVELFFFGID